MHAGKSDGAGFSEQSFVERRSDGEDTPAGLRTRFEHDYVAAGLTEEFGGAQAGETRADDHDAASSGLSGEPGREERRRDRRELKEAPAADHRGSSTSSNPSPSRSSIMIARPVARL